MAVVRTTPIQATSRRFRPSDFISPNLLLSTLLAFVPFGPGQQATAAAPATPRQRQEFRVQQAQNLLTTLLAVQAPSDTPRQPILQSFFIQRQNAQDLPPPNLLLSTLASAPEPPAEVTLRTPILQDLQRRMRAPSDQIYVRREAPAAAPAEDVPFFSKIADLDVSIRKPRTRVVSHSLNLAVGTGAPIHNDDWTIPRRARFFDYQIYHRVIGPPGEAPPVGDPFFQKIGDIDLSIRKPRARIVNYSLNLTLGEFRLLPGESFTVSAPRGLRRHIVEPIPNLLFSTLFVTPEPPFKPARWEQEIATRRKRPLPVESEGINNEIRGGGIMPFDPKLRFFDAATRRRQPLPVDSYGINAARLVPELPKVARLDERQATRARRSQDANTWLHRHNFALVDADRHFKYDWTITRGRRQHPQEPVFRNFILSQPIAPPFEAWRRYFEASPRRYPVHERPTLDQNFLLPRYVAIKPIGAQYFEPSPRPRQSVARYTWLHPLNLNLLGQDQFFYGPGRGPFNYDWSIKLRYRYPERASLNDIQRGPPIGILDFNPSVPGLEYSTFLEILEYRSKPDRLHFESLKDRLHFRIEDED